MFLRPSRVILSRAISTGFAARSTPTNSLLGSPKAMGIRLPPLPHAISSTRQCSTSGGFMPKSVAMTASRSGCVCRKAKLGYGTLSYAFERKGMVRTLSLFVEAVNQELSGLPARLCASADHHTHRVSFEVPSSVPCGLACSNLHGVTEKDKERLR